MCGACDALGIRGCSDLTLQANKLKNMCVATGEVQLPGTLVRSGVLSDCRSNQGKTQPNSRHNYTSVIIFVNTIFQVNERGLRKRWPRGTGGSLDPGVFAIWKPKLLGLVRRTIWYLGGAMLDPISLTVLNSQHQYIPLTFSCQAFFEGLWIS